MNDRDHIDRALATAVDEVQNGNVCCQGCYPIADTNVTFATYTAQGVERAFSEDGERPVGDRPRYSAWDEDEDDDPETGEREYPEPSYPDARILVAPLHIYYGVRDASVYSEEAVTKVRQDIVARLKGQGCNVIDPGNNDRAIEVHP